jgi:hypothetical protein
MIGRNTILETQAIIETQRKLSRFRWKKSLLLKREAVDLFGKQIHCRKCKVKTPYPHAYLVSVPQILYPLEPV